MSNFETLAAINVNDKVEKKQKFSYLSWAWAVDKLLRTDPAANWEYAPSVTFPDGTMMVFCTVTAFGIPRTMQLPVMNHSNKPIANPDAFAVNTAMQRCLVKAIALHGLGLYLYGGEDLPPDEPAQTEMSKKEFVDHCTAMSDATELGTDALKEAFKTAYKAAKGYGDEQAMTSLTAKYEEAKAMLKVAA